MADAPPSGDGPRLAAQPRDRRLVVWGLIIAVAVGLGATAHAVFSPAVLAHYADSPDSVDIARFAEQAGPSDLLRWWHGAWIQTDSPYYRPLSSVIFWLEYKAFGRSFQGQVLVSWIVHGVLCGLLYLLVLRLFPGPPVLRVALGRVASLLFNARLGPTGPGWSLAPVTYGVVAWWPGQTDQFCLVLTLLALMCFDGWLQGTRRSGLWQAGVLWLGALLFKEMAVSLPLVAGCLIVYREGRPSLSLWEIEGADGAERRRFRPGLAWRIVAPSLALVAAYLGVRSLMVPGAWGPGGRSIAYFAEKALWYVAERPRGEILARGAWLVAGACFAAACVYVYVRLPRRPSAVWLVLALLIGCGLIAQVAGDSFALIIVPRDLLALCTVTLFLLGCAVLAHARGGPTWPLLGMVAAIHLPILHVQGPHYLYWPAFFWALFNASLLYVVWERKTAGGLQWGGHREGSV